MEYIKLTKEEAIHRHYMMWEWIANETLLRHECVDKLDAFRHFGWDTFDAKCCNWCCEYCYFDCDKCLIQWPILKGPFPSCGCRSFNDDGLLLRWIDCVYKYDWRTAAYYALYISMLPEKK